MAEAGTDPGRLAADGPEAEEFLWRLARDLSRGSVALPEGAAPRLAAAVLAKCEAFAARSRTDLALKALNCAFSLLDRGSEPRLEALARDLLDRLAP